MTSSLLLAIETNELRFWTLARRVLERWREPARGELDGAIRWADDALRARREEIAYLSSMARARSSRPPARQHTPSFTGALRGGAATRAFSTHSGGGPPPSACLDQPLRGLGMAGPSASSSTQR